MADTTRIFNTGARSFPGFSLIESDGGIDCYEMDSNGLQVLLCPQGEARVATVMITYRVGSRHERQGETGATHFLEHMMFKGQSAFPRKAARPFSTCFRRRVLA